MNNTNQGHITKISILIVVPSLACGGLERNVALLCNHINTNRFDVCLAVVNNTEPFYQIHSPNIRIVDLQCKHVRQSLWKLKSLTSTVKPDIMLSAANHLNLLLAMFSWMFPRNIPIIARESSVVSINSKRARWPVLYEWLLKRFYHKLDMIVCQSAYMQDDLVHNYAVPVEKTSIVYNALEIPETNTEKKSSTIASFITVARLSEEKGIDRIIRALARLDMPFTYHIIGDGPMRSKLQELIISCSLQHNVFLTGSSKRPYADAAHATLFLMGSHYEGFPNVLIEANALGIPVVAFNAPGGTAEVVLHEKTGLMVEGNDESEFAEAIRKAVSFPFNREWIKAHTRQRYDAAKAVLQWEKLFTAIIEKKSA